MSDDTTQASNKTICSICYEDLNPILQDLQAISICGHVFHELCIQQWFEYCSKGKKQCPICKQTCSASDVSRLYFQSVGDSSDSNLSQKLQTHKEDPRELKLEVRRLEGKVNVLNLALESKKSDIYNSCNKLNECRERLEIETLLRNEALEQTHTYYHELNLKTQVLSETDSECDDLQKKNMDLAKQLATLKLFSDLDLEEDKIVKLASLGTGLYSKETVNILNKCLGARQKSYKELMEKYNKETRCCKELEKAKEQLEKLEKEIQKLETAKEMKDNEVLKAPKASKRTKNSPSVLNEVNHTLSDTCTRQDPTKKSDIHLGKTKRSRVSENISESDNKDGVSSYILMADDASKVSASPKFSSNDSVPQPTKRATTDASYVLKNVHGTSEHNGVPWHGCKDEDVVFVHETGQDKPSFNIVKEASTPALIPQEAADLCFSNGLLDVTIRHPGKWCKKGQPCKASGDLIAVGADGRGGTVKVLKSQNLSSLNPRVSSISTKRSKPMAKASLQARGRSQIDHFFSKTGQ